ncbi:MAG: hypothetical protein MUE69_10595 [Myxococcota bacterium]|nr:hypothetical protein [Myxococcota bacterium]
MSELGDPNAHAPNAKQWIAFGVALVVLAMVAIWIAGSRQADRRRVPTLQGRPLAGVWRATEVRDGCALDAPLAAGALFVAHPGRLPLVGPALHRCASPDECTQRERTRALGTTPPPVPLALLGHGCGDCRESFAPDVTHSDVDWNDALEFAVGLDGADDPIARALVAERETARETDGRCLRFRYLATLSRDADALVYERRVLFTRAGGPCAEHEDPPSESECVAARRWRLERE